MTTTQTHAAQVLTDAETDQHLDAVLNGAGSALRHYTTEFSLSRMRAAMREHEAAILAKLQPAQAGELPEPELGYIKTDKSNQPAYSARQMRAALSARKPLAGLTREQMEAGRHQVFSTNNPFCPCDSKTFRKVSEWTEREFCRINGLEVKT